MLCLLDSIRDDDPSWQRLLRAVEEAQTLTELLLAVWETTDQGGRSLQYAPALAA